MSARKVTKSEARERNLNCVDDVTVFSLEDISSQSAARIIRGLDNFNGPYVMKLSPPKTYCVHESSLAEPTSDPIIRVVGENQIWTTGYEGLLMETLLEKNIQYRHGRTRIKRERLISQRVLEPIKI